MTEKERFFCVLHGEPTDRPPCICPGGMMNMITEEVMDRCGLGTKSPLRNIQAMLQYLKEEAGEHA